MANKSQNEFVNAILEAKSADPDFAAVIKPIEADCAKQLKEDALEASPFANSTNQCEMHLNRALSSLKACLELRKLAHEIESEAVKAVWNQVVVDARTKTEERFDNEFYTHRIYTESEQYKEGLQVPAGRTPEGTFSSLKSALADRRAIALALEESFLERRAAPGSAFNFVERHKALRTYFTFLLSDSFLRARAAATGLKDIFNIETESLIPLLEPDSGILDRLLDWVMLNSRKLERLLANEIEFDANFMMRQGGPTDTQFLGMQWTSSKLTSTSGTFVLRDTDFPGLSHVRLRGVDIRVVKSGTPDAAGEAYPLWFKAPGVETKFRIFAPVVNAPNNVSSDDFRCNILTNRRPIGDWTLDFGNEAKSTAGKKFSEISEILIRLRVAAIVAP